MEFNEKLQELRNSKGLTQQELAEKLYVSRTAISKWELGRGYPSIDSLREIAKFFSITVDELISPREALDIAEKDEEQKKKYFIDLIYGILDLCASMFFFIPLFAIRIDGEIHSASLINISCINPYLIALYYVFVISTTLFGIVIFALQNIRQKGWIKAKTVISLVLSISMVLLFTLSLQPYAAILAFVLLIIKALIIIKWH